VFFLGKGKIAIGWRWVWQLLVEWVREYKPRANGYVI
jgi:hypothetical protein